MRHLSHRVDVAPHKNGKLTAAVELECCAVKQSDFSLERKDTYLRIFPLVPIMLVFLASCSNATGVENMDCCTEPDNLRFVLYNEDCEIVDGVFRKSIAP